MKRRYSKNAYRHIMKFVAPLPVELAHLWYARDYPGAGTTMRSRRGPDYSFSVAGPMYDDAGNSVGAIPVVHHDSAGNIKGVWGGPAYSNIFTNATPTAETKSLTAQKYCLQVFGTGASATCSYGTATPGSPLIFTATAGSTTFTPTDCAKWMLSAAGGFVFPYVPPGASVVSAAGTTGGNGASLTLDQRMLAAFRGRTDGVELCTTQSANDESTVTPLGNNRWNVVDHGTGVGDTQISISGLTIGGRLLLKLSNIVQTGSWVPVARVYDAGFVNPRNITYVNGEIELVVTTTAMSIRLLHDIGVSNSITYTSSIQRLLPATCTVAALTCMGVGSGELANSTNCGVISAGSNEFDLLYYSRYATAQEVLVKSYDKTNQAENIHSWNRDELHLRAVQTKVDGSQFRVGYRRYNLDKTPIDSAITWSAWVAFDNSFNPLSHLRWFLNGTVPIWQRAVAIWDKGAIADSEILKRMEAA